MAYGSATGSDYAAWAKRNSPTGSKSKKTGSGTYAGTSGGYYIPEYKGSGSGYSGPDATKTPYYSGQTGFLSDNAKAGLDAFLLGGNVDGGGGWPGAGGGGGGGGYRGGGGGGGGGAAPLTQDAFNQMLAMIQRKGPQLQWQQWNPAAYQGMDIEAWDPSIYNQAREALTQGYDQAGQQVQQGTDYARDALQRNWENYGDLRNLGTPTYTPTAANQFPGVAVGGEAAGAVNDANAEAAASNAAFQRFMQANDLVSGQAQGSRMHELELANQYYTNQLEAQRIADEAGISLSEARALQEWRRRQNERQYQDNALRQEWEREAGLYNHQGQTGVDQTNVGNEWAHIENTLAPLLELIMAGNGAGLDLSGVTA